MGCGLVLRVQGLHLGALAGVEQLASHARLHADAEGALEFAASVAHGDVVGDGNDDLLAAVVVGGALALVFGLLDGGLFVALVEVADDVGVQLLNALLERGETLDSARVSLNGAYLLEFMRALKGCELILSSMGRLTEGMGTLLMPES